MQKPYSLDYDIKSEKDRLVAVNDILNKLKRPPTASAGAPSGDTATMCPGLSMRCPRCLPPWPIHTTWWMFP